MSQYLQRVARAKSRLAVLISASVVFAFWAQTASAVELTFATTAPPGIHISKFFDAWAERVSAINPEALTIKVIHGDSRGSMATIYDNVKNGVADIGWITTGINTGKFQKANVTRLPELIQNAEAGSMALWGMISGGKLDDEFDELKPLAVHTFALSSIHTTFPVNSLADLKGKKIGVPSREASDMMSAIGATPISLQAPQFYQSVEKNLVGGIASNWTSFAPFKLHEVVSHHFEVNLGANNFFVGISPTAWNKLSPAAQEILMDHAGASLTRDLGKFWDGVHTQTKARVSKMPGHVVVELDQGARAEASNMLQPAVDKWLERTPGGKAFLDEFKKQHAAAVKRVN